MLDIINELDHKVNELLGKIDQYKHELNTIRSDVEGKNNYIHEIEQDNANLHNEIETLRNNANDEQQQQVEKLREIMGRIDNTNEHSGQ